MRILVCVKQVPFEDSPLVIREDRRWIADHEDMAYTMNRYDEHAMEEAVAIAESFPGVVVDAISVGPPRVVQTLRRALAFGAKKGIHILLPEEACPTPFEIASLIANFAKHEAYDLIFAGVMAEDDMQCLVGPLLAAILSIPCITAVIKTDLQPEKGKIGVVSEVEGGFHERSMLTLPALVTIQSGVNTPRYPALSHVLRSKSQPLTVIDGGAFKDRRPRESVTALSVPKRPEKGEILQGSPEEKAKALLALFHEHSLL